MVTILSNAGGYAPRYPTSWAPQPTQWKTKNPPCIHVFCPTLYPAISVRGIHWLLYSRDWSREGILNIYLIFYNSIHYQAKFTLYIWLWNWKYSSLTSTQKHLSQSQSDSSIGCCALAHLLISTIHKKIINNTRNYVYIYKKKFTKDNKHYSLGGAH